MVGLGLGLGLGLANPNPNPNPNPDPNPNQLFDFSERKQSNRAVAMLPSARLAGRPSGSGAAVGSASDTPVMITRVSDALQG